MGIKNYEQYKELTHNEVKTLIEHIGDSRYMSHSDNLELLEIILNYFHYADQYQYDQILNWIKKENMKEKVLQEFSKYDTFYIMLPQSLRTFCTIEYEKTCINIKKTKYQNINVYQHENSGHFRILDIEKYYDTPQAGKFRQWMQLAVNRDILTKDPTAWIFINTRQVHNKGIYIKEKYLKQYIH